MLQRAGTAAPSPRLGTCWSVHDPACTQVEASVIGRDCRIGVGACVSGSYLLDGVSVGPGAHVSDALLCDGAAVAAGAVLRPGCILSFKARDSIPSCRLPCMLLPARGGRLLFQFSPSSCVRSVLKAEHCATATSAA